MSNEFPRAPRDDEEVRPVCYKCRVVIAPHERRYRVGPGFAHATGEVCQPAVPAVPSAPRHDAGTGDHPAPTCECGARLNLKGQTKCADCIDRMIASAPPSPGGEDVGAGDEAVATGRGWFSYDPEDGVDFHATEREAREAADRALDMERDSAADGGWNENAVDICYGRVYGSARQVSATPTPGGEFDEIVDYGIVDDLPREESPGYLRAAVSRLAADNASLRAQLTAFQQSFDCVCGHNGASHREEGGTGAGRECLVDDCHCEQFGNVHMALTAARYDLAAASDRCARAVAGADEVRGRLVAERDEAQAGYHALDRNWQTVHSMAMEPIRAAVGLPDGTVPEIVEAIREARGKALEVAVLRLEHAINTRPYHTDYGVAKQDGMRDAVSELKMMLLDAAKGGA